MTPATKSPASDALKNVSEKDNTAPSLPDGYLYLALAYAFFVGFRMPSLWSIQYYLPSYVDGFHKRSLLGTLLQPLGDLRFNYWVISSLQFLVATLLVAFVVRSARSFPFRAKILVVLALVSPLGGYFFHDVGHAEQVLYLLLIVALSCTSRLLSLCLMVASLLTHEMAMLTTIPIFFLFSLLRGRSLATVVVEGGILLALFSAIFFGGQTSPDTITTFLMKLYSKANFGQRVDYYSVFLRHFSIQPLTYEPLILLLPEIFISLSVGLAASSGYWRRGGSPWSRTALSVLPIIITTGPLLLSIGCVDFDRFVFLSLVGGLVAAIPVIDALPLRVYMMAAFCYVALIATGSLHYFDSHYPRYLLSFEQICGFYVNDLGSLVQRIPKM